MAKVINSSYQIKEAMWNNWDDAMLLAWTTFMKYEAKEYSEEGIHNFKEFVTDETLRKMFIKGEYQMWVAIKNEQVIGMITLRNGNHISLLFVDERYHHLGIASNLMEVLKESVQKGIKATPYVTVNSSPYAVGFYEKVGFNRLDLEQTRDGIRYTPMKCQFIPL